MHVFVCILKDMEMVKILYGGPCVFLHYLQADLSFKRGLFYLRAGPSLSSNVIEGVGVLC